MSEEFRTLEEKHIHYKESLDLFNEGKFEEALDQIEQNLKENPNQIEASILKIKILISLKNYESALQLLEQITNSNLELFIYKAETNNYSDIWPMLLNNYALNLIDEGNYKKAKEVIEKVFEFEELDYTRITDIYGEILMLLGDYEGALVELEKAKLSSFVPIETHLNLAFCYENLYQFHNVLPYMNFVLEHVDDESSYRKYTNQEKLKQKIRFVKQKIIEMKKSIDFLIL